MSALLLVKTLVASNLKYMYVKSPLQLNSVMKWGVLICQKSSAFYPILASLIVFEFIVVVFSKISKQKKKLSFVTHFSIWYKKPGSKLHVSFFLVYTLTSTEAFVHDLLINNNWGWTYRYVHVSSSVYLLFLTTVLFVVPVNCLFWWLQCRETHQVSFFIHQTFANTN